LIAAPTGQNSGAKQARTREPSIRLRGTCAGDACANTMINDTRADDPEGDFLHAGSHKIESRLRL
jgi:hypothetical protein